MKYNLANDGFRGVVDMLAREEIDMTIDMVSLTNLVMPGSYIDPNLVAEQLDQQFGSDLIVNGAGDFVITLTGDEWHWLADDVKDMIGDFNRYWNIKIICHIIPDAHENKRSAKECDSQR